MTQGSEGALCAVRPILVQSLCKDAKEGKRVCPAIVALDRVREHIISHKENEILAEWGLNGKLELFSDLDPD